MCKSFVLYPSLKEESNWPSIPVKCPPAGFGPNPANVKRFIITCVVGFLLAPKSSRLIFFTCSCRIVYEVTLSTLLLSMIIFSLRWQFQMWIKNSQKTTKEIVLKAHTI